MSKLEVGDIIKVFNLDITPPNYKYSICIHIKNNLFLLINSKNRTMYECTPILKSKHKFLDNDSYISCNRLFEYSSWELKNQTAVCSLDYNELINLKYHIEKNVNLLGKKQKDMILEAIEERLTDY